MKEFTPRVRFVVIVAAIALGPVSGAAQTTATSVQYRSPAGVEYRSLPDTEAITNARAAVAAEPRNVAKIIDLGVAQSGARQFREAIATFTRGLEIHVVGARGGEPDEAQTRDGQHAGARDVQLVGENELAAGDALIHLGFIGGGVQRDAREHALQASGVEIVVADCSEVEKYRPHS